MRRSLRALIRALPIALFAAAGCSGGSTPAAGGAPAHTPTPAPTTTPTSTPSTAASPTPTPTPAPTATATPAPTATPTPAPTATPTPAHTAQPQVVYVNFNYAEKNSTYGTVAYYAMTSTSPSVQLIYAVAGSQIVFDNTDTSEHTASGLGTGGFPASFDNSEGTTASGSAIDGGTTWSTGALAAGTSSNAFTLGPPGTYYFGCYYHYTFGMRDVIVSTN